MGEINETLACVDCRAASFAKSDLTALADDFNHFKTESLAEFFPFADSARDLHEERITRYRDFIQRQCGAVSDGNQRLCRRILFSEFGANETP